MEKEDKQVMRLQIVLKDGSSFFTQDEYTTEEETVNQCQMFATNGYYSRVAKVYYPPFCIDKIKLVQS